MSKVNTWEFVEKYYPNYSSSDEIAHNNDLHLLMNEEEEEESTAANLLFTEYEGNRKGFLEVDYNESLMRIYEKAIQGYLESKLESK